MHPWGLKPAHRASYRLEVCGRCLHACCFTSSSLWTSGPLFLEEEVTTPCGKLWSLCSDAVPPISGGIWRSFHRGFHYRTMNFSHFQISFDVFQISFLLLYRPCFRFNSTLQRLKVNKVTKIPGIHVEDLYWKIANKEAFSLVWCNRFFSGRSVLYDFEGCNSSCRGVSVPKSLT